VTEKETAREKMLQKQKAIEAEGLGIADLTKRGSTRFSPGRALHKALTGASDFGTEVSPAAERARQEARLKKSPDYPMSSRHKDDDEDILKAGREAAKQEQREAARGMKKGGTVASKRADGIAQRGKTRGQMK